MESQEVLTSCPLQIQLATEILQTDRNVWVAAVTMPDLPMSAFHMGTLYYRVDSKYLSNPGR